VESGDVQPFAACRKGDHLRQRPPPHSARGARPSRRLAQRLDETLGIPELPPLVVAPEGEEVPSAASALRRPGVGELPPLYAQHAVNFLRESGYRVLRSVRYLIERFKIRLVPKEQSQFAYEQVVLEAEEVFVPPVLS
jgi:hypothetical protein